jgi:hypothetical protein
MNACRAVTPAVAQAKVRLDVTRFLAEHPDDLEQAFETTFRQAILGRPALGRPRGAQGQCQTVRRQRRSARRIGHPGRQAQQRRMERCLEQDSQPEPLKAAGRSFAGRADVLLR